MSVLPNVAGQTCCTAGFGNGFGVANDSRYASTDGQSDALRTSMYVVTAKSFTAAVVL